MATDPSHIGRLAEHLFRHESGKMLSVLVKLFGLRHVSIAEDIVQDTLLAAYETWKIKGAPEQPRAWLYRTAKNKTIDFLRRRRHFDDRIAPQLIERAVETEWLDAFFLDTEIADAQLRMMFACCHPAIPPSAQIALILRTLCGLSAKEIAAAFLTPEEAVAKRLYRAKEKIREEGLVLEMPEGPIAAARFDGVLQAVYLLFNEGYKSASSPAVIRRDLCMEALRLGDLLARHVSPYQTKAHALQSLMYFHTARFDARLDDEGRIILLERQDRKRWDQILIAKGYQHLRWSAGAEVCEYHIEAAIASYHASAPDFEQTNWKAIFYCYNLLYKISPSPFVALNRAIALGFAEGPQAGLAALTDIAGMNQNYLYHTALGDFYVKTGEKASAAAAYQTALALAPAAADRQVIEEKMAGLHSL